MYKVLLFFSCFLFLSCENIPNPFSEKKTDPPIAVEPEMSLENESLALIATLDNLTIRSGDSLSAAFLTKVKERDTLIYLEKHSKKRLNLILRGKYFHEPWLHVRTKSGKRGWAYGGGVRFVSEKRANKLMLTGSNLTRPDLSAQRMLPDTAWTDAQPVDWSVAGFDDPFDFKTFLIHFKYWVKNDDIEKIASVFAYPVESIYNRKYLKENYSDIFDNDLKKLIREQRIDQIFRNAKGAMFGNGEIWFSNTSDGYRIIALNAYAQKLADSRKIDDYRIEFADLNTIFQRPTKEANPPKINIIIKEKAISGEIIKFRGNQKETRILEDLEFRFSEGSHKIFERKNGIEVLQRMTFSEKSSGVIHLKFDDYENFGAGQKFVAIKE